MNVLETSGLSIEINTKTLIKNISITVHAGEVLAVLGPNGSGKSTFIKAISGDYPNYSGHITLCNRDVKTWDNQERAKHIAVLPQLSLLNFPYTVEDVVALGRTPHGTGHKLDNAIVYEVMQTLDITHLQGRLYTELSGGEKQRTQLARVMAQIWRAEDAEQRLLLLDEPTTALDIAHIQQLMQVIKQFAKRGVGVIMVVHDINLAIKYADSIQGMHAGQCIAQGKTTSTLTEDLIARLFDTRVHIIQDPKTQQRIVVT